MGLPVSTRKIRRIIQDELLMHCSKVYYRRAKNTSGLHVVFRIDDFKAEEVMRAFALDVRVAGRGDCTDDVEDLADEIWDAFDHLYYLDDDIELHTYQNTRSIVDEEDASVVHRRLLFEIRAL